MNTKKIALFSLSAVAAVVLTGCTSQASQKSKTIFNEADQATKALTKASFTNVQDSIYSFDKGTYVNNDPITTVKLDTKGNLPAKYKNKRVNFAIEGENIALTEVLKRVSDSDVLGVRTILQSEIRDGSYGGLATIVGNDGNNNYGANEGANTFAGQTFDIKVDEMDYKGTATGLLDYIANKTNLAWKYSNGAVVFYKYEERIFELAALSGTTEVEQTLKTMKSTSSSGDSSVTGSDQSGQSTVYKTKSSIWEDVMGALRNSSTKGGRLTAVPSAGRIVAVDTPEALAKMERQLAEFNRIYAKRVQLNVKIYQVEQNDSEDYQINWSTVVNEAFGSVVNAPNAIASLGGTLSNSAFGINFKGLPKNVVQSADINLAKALSGVGKTSLLTESTLETVNGQVVPLTNVKEIAYVKSTSATSNDSSTSSTINPGKVSEGLTMSFLPRINREGDVLVKYTLDLAKVDEIKTFNAPAGDATVQLPTVSSRNFSNMVKARNGEMLVLAGFQQVTSNNDQGGMFGPKTWWLGGHSKDTATRTSLVIVITPYIMD